MSLPALDDCLHTTHPVHLSRQRRTLPWVVAIVALLFLSACGGGDEAPTRTPVPTWTPTVGAPAEPQAEQPVVEQPTLAPVEPADTPVPQEPVVMEEPTPVPAVPTDTSVPPTPEPPTNTPEPTVPPTDTPTPAPTPTPNYAFVLETAEKIPTESLAANVVRIWVYVYSPSNFGLPGYSIRVTHNGAPLTVEEVSEEGVPGKTRASDGPWTRFTNLSVILVESQAGLWEVQLVDAEGIPAGPAAQFELSADEVTRELYLRYREQ